MSRALDFLLQARPEAMRAYFSFLKQAGEHLDEKTKSLISVITKVHAKTPTGLRQYLPRALKAGASADEVIDALLMAMPALGFSKIVWAIDVILDMDLPEFAKYKRENTPAEEEWSLIGGIDQFAEDRVFYARIANRALLINKSGNDFVVYDARCPHKGNTIPESGIAGDVVTCPFHEWKFDRRNGKCVSGGSAPLKALSFKVEDGKLWVKL